ncbi:hypothetical protein PT974_00099 [Cladobotryum mycophilum]|uniref:Uncharacterized protein n=1 Tax=Cladobotryum mycophilum TaxID=491253 RepID=A0ABR0T0S7_9HYPO
MTEQKHFKVWIIKYHLAMQDLELPGLRYHIAIFVEADSELGSGFLHQVLGDITTIFMGYTGAALYPSKWEEILRAIPPPPQQKTFNTRIYRTEFFKTQDPLTFYEPGEPRGQIMKCTEWTDQKAIPALREAGLISKKEDS